jgi:hypothetical protein
MRQQVASKSLFDHWLLLESNAQRWMHNTHFRSRAIVLVVSRGVLRQQLKSEVFELTEPRAWHSAGGLHPSPVELLSINECQSYLLRYLGISGLADSRSHPFSSGGFSPSPETAPMAPSAPVNAVACEACRTKKCKVDPTSISHTVHC